MTPYDKTIWINDETYLDEDNMNKIENQLDILTNNAISESEKNYITETELSNKGYATETYVITQINNSIGTALGGSY